MEFMPLYGDRMLGSETWIQCDFESKVAALRLWWRAYAHEVPASSLPNNDTLLAEYAGYGNGIRAWKKVKDQAMRGFVLCSDGRWYHEVVAKIALKSWEMRKESREANDNKSDRQRRWREKLKLLSAQLRDLGVDVPRGASVETLETLLASTVDVYKASRETGKTATATATATGQQQTYVSPPSTRDATRRGAVSALLRASGVQITPGDPFLVQWVESGVTDAHLTEAVDRARLNKPKPKPIPAKYLDPIVREVMQAKVNGHGRSREAAWWSSNEGIDRKGREIGLPPGALESYEDYKVRIFAKLKAAP